MIPQLLLNELCHKKICGVMATVLSSDGHGPAKAGDSLFWAEGKLISGTVGGGGNEQQVLEACANPTAKKQVLKKKDLWQTLEDRLYAPIGIPISSRSPAEVAVSIVAELIQTRAS